MDSTSKENGADSKNIEVEKIVEATLQQKDCCDVAEMIHKASLPLETPLKYNDKDTTLGEFLSAVNPDVLKSHKGQEEQKKPSNSQESQNPQDGGGITQNRGNQREISSIGGLRDSQEQDEAKRHVVSNRQDIDEMIKANSQQDYSTPKSPFLGNNDSFVDMVKNQEQSDFGRSPNNN